MSFKGTFYTLVLLGAIGYGGSKLVKTIKKIQNTSADATQSAALPEGLSVYGLAQFLRAPQNPDQNLQAVLARAKVAKECESYVTGLLKLDLMSFKQPGFAVKYQDIPEVSSSCVLTDDWVSAPEKEYLKNCFLTNPTKTEVLANDCVASIFLVRAGLTHFLLKEVPLKEVSSLPELVNLIYAEFAIPRYLEQNSDSMKLDSIANQILEVYSEPLYAVEKIKLIGLITDTLERAKGKTLREQDLLWEKPEQKLESLQKLIKSSFPTEPLQAVIKTRGFSAELTESYANKLLVQNPSDVHGLFLKALYAWRKGDHEESIVAIRKVMELEPENKDYAAVFEALKSAGVGDEAFQSKLGYGLTLQDFDK